MIRPVNVRGALGRARWGYIAAGVVSAVVFGLVAGQLVTRVTGSGATSPCSPPACESLPSAGAGQADPTGAMRTLLDQARGGSGCQPLSQSTQLTSAARDHVADMLTRHYVGHAGAVGEGPQSRASLYGYAGETTELIVAGVADPAQAAQTLFGSLASDDVRQRARNCSWLSAGVAFDARAVKPEQAGGVWVIVLGNR